MLLACEFLEAVLDSKGQALMRSDASHTICLQQGSSWKCRHTSCHSCNSSSSEGRVLLRCTAGSGSGAEGAAVKDSDRCKLSVFAVLLACSASRQHIAVQACIWNEPGEKFQSQVNLVPKQIT